MISESNAVKNKLVGIALHTYNILASGEVGMGSRKNIKLGEGLRSSRGSVRSQQG